MFENTTLYFAYYPFVILSFIYMLKKVIGNKIGLYIVMIFWAGMFQFLSNLLQYYGIPFNLFNIYKIIIVIWGIYLSYHNILNNNNKIDISVGIAWLLFSVIFWLSYIFYRGDLITILSQYFYKLGLIYIIYNTFKYLRYDVEKAANIKKLVITILYIQIILSIIKIILSFIIVGHLVEYIVGSVSSGGAGTAVVLPISGLILYWHANDKVLKGRKIIISLSFILIGIASAKRSPVFMFPFIYLLLTAQSLNFNYLIRYIPIAFILFYIGVRSNPSLNPEEKNWGSFNLNYALNYALEYNFGETEIGYILSPEYENKGRGGNLFLIFEPQRIGLKEGYEYIIGKGVYDVSVKKYGRFIGGSYDIESKGLMSSLIGNIYRYGYIGAILIIIFVLLIFRNVADKKLRMILTIFYLWELIFYSDQFMFSSSSAIVIILVCMISSYKPNNYIIAESY